MHAMSTHPVDPTSIPLARSVADRKQQNKMQKDLQNNFPLREFVLHFACTPCHDVCGNGLSRGITLHWVNGVAETTDPRRRSLLGLWVMAGIAVLQLSTEYLGSRDAVRLVSKSIALLIGLPMLTIGAFALFRWTSRKRYGTLGPAFVGAVIAGLFFSGLLWAIRHATPSWAPLPASQQEPWGEGDVLRVGFTMGLTYFALWALAFVLPTVVEDARVRTLETEKLRTQAELAQVRSHLEPHFLLNTLNAIAGLVTEDPRKACQLLGALGDLLRDSVTTSDGEMETLDRQIEWLRRYAQILEARHAGHLAFHWEVDGGTRQILLPRLLLQPLVENAVKHGALMRAGGGEITVRTELADGQKLICTIEDNGPGVPEKGTRPGAFGLVSVRRRLALRYSDAASLRLESSPKGTRSVVELPLEQGGRS
jgi:signal transduction histidine kinase